LVKGAGLEPLRLLAAVGSLVSLARRRHVFTDFREAIAHAARHVASAAHVGEWWPGLPSQLGGTLGPTVPKQRRIAPEDDASRDPGVTRSPVT
jgi:hypothetical protein